MGEKADLRGKHVSSLIPGILLIILASQIYISLFSGRLLITVAAALLPILAFLWPDFLLMPSALLASVGIFLLRLLLQPAGSFAQSCQVHAPEMLFYLVDCVLLSLYLRRVPLRPVRPEKFLPLAGIDMISNVAELLVRTGVAAFAPLSLLQLLGVAAVRTFLVWATLRMLDAYSIQVLRREEAERYQRLLLMTASLKSEVAWMTKGTALIEDTMHTAYHLYGELRDSGAQSRQVEAALTIAKDIHEVKKEYFQIVRGITEALEGDVDSDGMELGELLRIMGESTRRTAHAAGKTVSLTTVCTEKITLRQHHYLMSVLRNLLNNAVEAAPDGEEAHLTLHVQSEGDELVFQVEDDCGGILPRHLEQIFLPGFSSKINETTGEVNRGLGLTIVKELVEDRLHGSVSVRSEEGKTVFAVRVSRRELMAEED